MALLTYFGFSLLAAASLAVVAIFFLLGQYAHPSSDDFCMAAGVSQHGLYSYLWAHYFEWSGRYSSNALYAIYPLVFSLFEGYWLIPVILVAALFLAAAFLLSSVFRIGILARPVLLSSLCFVAVYLLGMLDPAGSLYWMAGAFTYQTSNILLLVIVGLMFRLADQQQRSQGYLLLTALLLLVVIVAIGANETGMIAITAVTAVAAYLHMKSGWRKLTPWLLILATALGCFAVVYFSPGNAIRAADFPLRHDLLRTIEGSFSVGSKTFWIWLSNPVLIISGLLTPFAIFRLQKVTGRSLSVSRTWVLLLAVSTFSLPFLLQFPAWWAMGGWPPARTLDSIYFLFLLGWFSTIAAVTLHLADKSESAVAKPSFDNISAIAVVILSVGFTVAVLANPAMQGAKHDLFYTAEPWHEYMNRRYVQINQAVADGRLLLAVEDYRQEYPRSLYFNDIMYNPQHWRNVCYADYFGLEKIKRDRGDRGSDRGQTQK